MTSKKPKLAFKFLAGAAALTFAIASCNGSGDKTETKDTVITTPPVVVDSTPPPPPIDTTKMDTASTRPVKTPDKTEQ